MTQDSDGKPTARVPHQAVCIIESSIRFPITDLGYLEFTNLQVTFIHQFAVKKSPIQKIVQRVISQTFRPYISHTLNLSYPEHIIKHRPVTFKYSSRQQKEDKVALGKCNIGVMSNIRVSHESKKRGDIFLKFLEKKISSLILKMY